MSSANILRASLLSAWKPPQRMSVSECATKHLYLSPEYSKEVGYYNPNRYPFLNEIMDRLSPDDPARIVVFRGPIQMGKSMCGQAFVTSTVTQYPGPTLWVTDTDTKAELFSKKRLDMMIRDDPTLQSLFAESKSRNKDNTIKLKTFPGGDIQLVGAQSASGLTSNTFRYAIVDEVDDHKANVSYAGSSVSLALGRMTTYGDLSKCLIVSSPKVKGDSEIDAWHDRGDRRVYMVPCPHCGSFQTLRWRDEGENGEYRLIWDKGDPSSVRYSCAICKKEFVEVDKITMLPQGRWEPTIIGAPDQSITSYSLNALYSPFGAYSWADMVRQWESAMERLKAGDVEEHRTFCNTRLAQSYEPPADAVDPRALEALVEPDFITLPDGVRTIVTATDTQDDRLEVLTLGVGVGLELWVLDYNVILSDPLDTGTWAKHDEVINKVYIKGDGTKMRARASCVDSGGHRTSAVYDYCRRRADRNVYAIKGKEGRRPIWDKIKRRGHKNKQQTGIFYLVGTDDAKDLLHSILQVRAKGPRYLHVQESIPKRFTDFFKQLTAEKRVKGKDSKGKTVWHWEKTGDNEVLDTFVYALGAIYSLIVGGYPIDKVQPVKEQVQEPIVEVKVEEHLTVQDEEPILDSGKPKFGFQPRPKPQQKPNGGKGNSWWTR